MMTAIPSGLPFTGHVPDPVDDRIKDADGSYFVLKGIAPGLLQVGTSGDSQVVRDFIPLTLDLVVHLLEDGRTALARAHVVYRYGNPGSEQVAEPMRSEVLESVVSSIHAWRRDPSNARRAGVLAEVEDVAREISATKSLVESLTAGERKEAAALRLAQARYEIVKNELSAARTTLASLKKHVKPTYEVVAAAPTSTKSWYAFKHAMGGDAVVVQAHDVDDADRIMTEHLGYDLEDNRNSSAEVGDLWRFSGAGPREDGGYEERPSEEEVLNLVPRASRPWDRNDRMVYLEAPDGTDA